MRNKLRAARQTACALSIALGVCLLTAGIYATGMYRDGSLEEFATSVGMRPSETGQMIATVTIIKGLGAGAITLGVLGLVIPWINAVVHRGECLDDADEL
jgi:hypothetical protein